MKQPCFRVQQLAHQAQTLISKTPGIQSAQLHKALGIKAGYFKLVLNYFKCHKKRLSGHQFNYYPIDAAVAPIPEKPPQYSAELLETAAKMQAFIDRHDGVNGLQIRIELRIDLQFFKKCIKHIKCDRAKTENVTIYYKKQPKAKPIKPAPYIAPIFTLGDKPTTIWRTAPPWMQNIAQT
jgi:hypothetical protein